MSNRSRARTYDELLPSEMHAYWHVVELLDDPGNFDYVPLSEEARAVVAEEAGEEAANTPCMVPKYMLPGDERPGRLDGVRMDGGGYIRYEWLRFHRISYELNVADIPAGYVVDHLCHQRWCSEPSHLRACTPKENAQNERKRGELWIHPHPELIPELTEEQHEKKREREREHYLTHKEEMNARAREYYQANREKFLELARDYRRTHEEEVRECQRKCREKRIEEYRERDRNRYREHREELRAKARKSYQKHREETLERRRRQRATETPEQREARLAKQREYVRKCRARKRAEAATAK